MRDEGDKLTEEEDLGRLLTLLDESLGLQQALVYLSGDSDRLCLLLDALRAFVLGLFWRGREGRGEGVVGPAGVGEGLHEGGGKRVGDGRKGGRSKGVLAAT